MRWRWRNKISLIRFVLKRMFENIKLEICLYGDEDMEELFEWKKKKKLNFRFKAPCTGIWMFSVLQGRNQMHKSSNHINCQRETILNTSVNESVKLFCSSQVSEVKRNILARGHQERTRTRVKVGYKRNKRKRVRLRFNLRV